MKDQYNLIFKKNESESVLEETSKMEEVKKEPKGPRRKGEIKSSKYKSINKLLNLPLICFHLLF